MVRKFSVGDKVVIKCDEEALQVENNAYMLAAMFSGLKVDEVKAGMVGTIAETCGCATYVVDFGEGYKGVSLDGESNGTYAPISEEVLELVEESEECNTVEADYDIMMVTKIKGDSATLEYTENGETISHTTKCDAELVAKVKIQGILLKLAKGMVL